MAESSKLTWRAIVADGEVGRHITRDSAQTAGAVLGVAADVGGGLPDHLREMTPGLEVAHIRRRLTEQAVVELHLVVVHILRENASDVVWLRTGANVLTVPAATELTAEGSVCPREESQGKRKLTCCA